MQSILQQIYSRHSLDETVTYISKIPDICKKEPCLIGVDEAGRGPVLGPMVYAIAYCPLSYAKELATLKFDDSKKLKESQRTDLGKAILDNSENIGYAYTALSPHDISISGNKKLVTGSVMTDFSREKYNLNAMAHDTTINLIRAAVDKGVIGRELYVDTVGPCETYQAKLAGYFPEIAVTVSKKADSLFPIVSAASICAKVTRDYIVENWKFGQDLDHLTSDYGSGYSGDPNTVKWLNKAPHKVFGFPNFVRFNWETCKRLLEKSSHQVEWETDPIDSGNHKNILNYFEKDGKKPKSHVFFSEMRVQSF